MITIEILEVRQIEDNGIARQHVEITITDGVDTFAWSIGNVPLDVDMQIYLDAQANELWEAASTEGQVEDIYELTLRRVVKAFVLVTLDEINVLRTNASLPERTAAQLKETIKAKLKENII